MSIQPKVIALGFFDGVHLGHGALLRRTVEESRRRGVRSAVFTWAQPPKEVVTGVPVPLINSPEDRAWLAKSLYDIDDVIMVPFNKEMMTTSWEDFITEILIKRYHAVHLVAGHDHRFGHKNQGTPELLKSKCAELGLGCDIIPEVTVGGITVSSTYIRRLVSLGQVERAMEPKMISSGPTVLIKFVTRHPTNRPGTASGRKKGSTVSASEKRHWMGP